MAKPWSGMLAPVGVPTGDGRRFQRGGVTHRALPLPLNWQRQSSDGHLTSVTIGSIEELEILEDQVFARGQLFDDAESESLRADVLHAMELIRQGVVGPSVDPGAVQAQEVLAGSDEPISQETFEAAMEENGGEFPAMELLFTAYEIAGATLVSTPAFSQVTFCLDDEPELAALVAAITGSTSLPVSDRDRSWDGAAAAGRVFDRFTNENGEMDTRGVARAFLWQDGDPQNRGSWKLPFADVVNGELQIIPQGVAATAGGRGVDATSAPDSVKSGLRARVCVLYDRVRREFEDWPSCPFDERSADTRPEAAIVAAQPDPPAVDLFMDPGLEQITALAREILPDGRVRIFGHLADPSSCHRGFRDQCMTPPESMTDYALFHRYPMETSEGLISVGRITSGLGKVGNGCRDASCAGLDDHACVNFSFLEAVDHHDGLRTLAWVRVGIDARNPGAIWFSGLQAPDLGEEELAVLARRRVSGDWRDLGATRELCEVLALAEQEPGFEVPRTAVGYRNGRQISLVAAAQVLPPAAPAAEPVEPGAERPVELSAGTMQAAEPVLSEAPVPDPGTALARMRMLALQNYSK